MTKTFITGLSSHASGPLSTPVTDARIRCRLENRLGDHTSVLSALLSWRNGFYAFERALHVFSLEDSSDYSLLEWNHPALWVSHFDANIRQLFFFAQDLFGDQFAIRVGDSQILKFEGETSEIIDYASGLDEWCEKIVHDPDYEIGYSIARDWRAAFGEIPSKKRLFPTTPFVLGGKYEISSLRAVRSNDIMRFRAQLSRQIRDLPDGASVSFDFSAE